MVGPIREQVAQPKILTPRDERLGQIQDLIEDEEPIRFCHHWIEFARDDSGRDIFHDYEAIQRFRIAARGASETPSTIAIAASSGTALGGRSFDRFPDT